MKLLALNIFLLFPLLSWAQSNTPLPVPNPWPRDFLSKLTGSLYDQWDSTGNKINASLFESLTDRTLLELGLGGDSTISFQVRRKVFDNQDILDSWTVVDAFNIPVELPIPISVNELNVGAGSLGFQVGFNFGLTTFNIRQVTPSQYEDLRSVQSINDQLEEASVLMEDLDSDDKNEEEMRSWRSDNPRTLARYSKFFNILSHPLRLPLTKKRLLKMPVDEISSFGLNGAVQFGATVGWSDVSISDGLSTSISTGVGISTYISGNYRISVWKEAEDKALLKLTRIRSRGVNTSIGTGDVRKELFTGMVVLGKEFGPIEAKIIPFNLLVNRNYSRQFDVGYRYDLNSETALDAYQKAVFGRFKASEALSGEDGSGVTKVFTRNQRSYRRTREYEMKLSLFLERARGTSRGHSQATIMLDGKTSHIFKGESTNYRGFDTIWGSTELHSHLFMTTINERDYRSGNGGAYMKIEGRIEDSRTSGKEIYRYMKEVEMATGLDDLFEIPPLYGPSKLSRYGKTSFYYEVGLKKEQIQKFIKTSKRKLWKILAQAFGVKEKSWSNGFKRFYYQLRNGYATLANIPLALLDLNLKNGGNLIIAKRFYKHLKKLKKIKDPRKLTKEMSKLFQTVNHSVPLIRVIRLALPDEKLAYKVSAKSDNLFGEVSRTGNAFSQIDPIIENARRRIDFDEVGPRRNFDHEALVEGIILKKLNRDEIEIRYNLSEKPKYVFLRVDKTPTFGRRKNLKKWVIAGSELFKKGANRLVIGRYENRGIKKELSSLLFNGKYTTISMAISLKDHLWGPVASDRALMPPANLP